MSRDVLELLARRAGFLELLADGAVETRDLVAELSYSRTTVNRALRELQDEGLVERADGGYTATAAGELAWQSFRRYQRETRAAVESAPALAPLGDATDLPPGVVAEATVTADATAADAVPAPADRLTGWLAAPDADVLSRLDGLPEGTALELVVAPGALSSLCDRAPGTLRALVERPATTLSVAETPAYSLLVADDRGSDGGVQEGDSGVQGTESDGRESGGAAAPGRPAASGDADEASEADADASEDAGDAGRPSAAVVVHEAGSVHGVVGDVDPAWARRAVADRTAGAERVDGVLAEHLPAGPAVAQVRLAEAAPAAFDDDPPMPPSLSGQGFERLTADYFDRDPEPPASALQSGFTPLEVQHGYAIERTGPGEDDDPLATRLRERLAAGTDCALVGPPGTGKSTTCMRVAVEWHERATGPVIYRAGSAGGGVEDPDLLAAYLQAVAGHALVVVEDAPQPDNEAVFEAVAACADRDDVSVLLDARDTEWAEAPPPADDVATVSMPPVVPDEAERLADRVESLTGVEVDADPETVLASAADPGDGPTAGSMYLLKHWLSLHEDDDAPASALTADVERVHEMAADSDAVLATDVAVLVTLLGLAGVAVRRELVYALAFGAGEDEDAAEAALSTLAGEALFEYDPARQPARFRPREETWATAFLRGLLERAGEAAARERFCRVVSLLVTLADDAERRQRVADALGGRGTHLVALADDPGAWADDVVEAVFEVGAERGQLAPLYGHTDESPVDLPDAGGPELSLQVATWRGDAYAQQGDNTAERREYRWLLDNAGDLASDESTAEQYLARAELRLGQKARAAGDVDRAEELLERSLDRYRDVDDPEGRGRAQRNLGVINAMRQQFETAERYFEAALETHRAAGDRDGLANAYNDRGLLAKKRADPDVAEDCLSASRDLFATLGNPRREAVATMNLGTIAMERNDYESGRRLLVRALGLTRAAGYERGEASVLNNLASVALRQCDLDAAEDYCERAVAKSRELDDSRGELAALRNRGEVARLRGRYDTAEDYLEQARAVVEDGDNRPGIDVMLARVYRDRGDLDAAAEMFESVEEGYPYPGRGARNLAEIARLRGDLDAAETHAVRSLDHYDDQDAPGEQAVALAVQARIAMDRGDLSEAAAVLDRAAEYATPDEPDRRTDFAVATACGQLRLRRGDHEAAVDFLEPVAAACRDAGAVQPGLRAVDPLVTALAGAGRTDAAVEWANTGVEMATDAGLDDDAERFRERVTDLAGR